MKLVSYECSWILWLLTFNHTVLVSKWKILSYELFPFWQWSFKLYNEDNFRYWKITHSEEIKWVEIDLEKYENKKWKGIWCYEALEPILRENNIQTKYYGDIKYKNISYT